MKIQVKYGGWYTKCEEEPFNLRLPQLAHAYKGKSELYSEMLTIGHQPQSLFKAWSPLGIITPK